ncbi:MAG: tetratricopeptide repeat protein, partial [Gammaproteobacteria bacterium]
EFARHFPGVRGLKQFLTFALVAVMAACGQDAGPGDHQDSLPVPRLDALSASAADQIQAALEAALDNPDDAAAVGRYALVLHAYRQLEPADEAYRRARVLDDDDGKWCLYQGILFLDTGRPEEAIECFRDAPREPVAVVYEARAAISLGRRDEAERLLQQLLEKSPDRVDALVELAGIMRQKGEFVAAEELYRRAVDLQEGLAEAHYGLAQVLRAQGDQEAALAQLEMFEAYREQPWQAADDPRRTIASWEVSDSRYVEQAKASVARSDFESAIEALEQARHINPENLSTLTNLVALYGRLGRLEEALDAYGAAIEIDPNYYQVHFNLGVVMASAGRAQEAESALRRASAVSPDRPEPYLEYGKILSRGGEPEAAVQQFRRALELAPNDLQTRFLLGRQLAILGDSVEAISYLEPIAELDDPAVPSMLRVLAGAYGQAGDVQSARRSLETALEAAHRWDQAELARQIERDLSRLAALEPEG